MKQALLIGCGGKRGEYIIKGCAEAGYSVTNLGSTNSSLSNVKNIEIDWDTLELTVLHKILKTIDHKIDFIFFNQNASSLSQTDFIKNKETLDTWGLIKSWSKSYWLSCQLPYFLIQTLDTNLHKQSIIGWMLSSYIDLSREGVDDHPDYSGYKFTNYLIMKNFSKKFNCFGISPDFTDSESIKSLINNICLGNKIVDGDIFGFDYNRKNKYNSKKEK